MQKFFKSKEWNPRSIFVEKVISSRKRGITLIEASLFLVFSIFIISTGLVLFEAKKKASKEGEQIQAVAPSQANSSEDSGSQTASIARVDLDALGKSSVSSLWEKDVLPSEEAFSTGSSAWEVIEVSHENRALNVLPWSIAGVLILFIGTLVFFEFDTRKEPESKERLNRENALRDAIDKVASSVWETGNDDQVSIVIKILEIYGRLSKHEERYEKFSFKRIVGLSENLAKRCHEMEILQLTDALNTFKISLENCLKDCESVLPHSDHSGPTSLHLRKD